MVQVRVQEQQVCYVVMSNAVAAIPYNAWSNAAARIQDAVDVCEKVGGVVLVSNGVYDTGGRVVYGAMTNRVAILKPMTVRSVNGPDVTVICGLGPVGDGAVRCAYVPNSALLAGFTLINGATLWSGNEYREMSGGGVCCEPGGVVSNCIISGNVAALYGGGACGGTLENCTIARNSVSLDGGGTYGGTVNNCIVSGNSAGNNGGGSYDGTLHNCTVSGNSADEGGGGVCFGNLDNCIVYGNSAPEGSNWNGGAFHNCCTTPDAPGTNNVADRPQFLNPSVGNYRLMATSPCIDRGVNQSWMLGSTDLDGNPRIRNGTVDMGAYEFAFEADLRGLLQGPYDTNTHAMTTLLSTNVPLTSHYADNAVATEAIPSNAADWVVVEVRKTNAVAIASTSAFLDRNGNVMAKDGGMGIVVEASAGQYYVTLKHRNHLAARSAQPVAFTNTTVSYNFTTGTNQYYGGTNACVQLEPGVWGMIGGDADGDGKITDVDRQIVSQQMGRTGYLSGDLNLDGKVDGNDQ